MRDDVAWCYWIKLDVVAIDALKHDRSVIGEVRLDSFGIFVKLDSDSPEGKDGSGFATRRPAMDTGRGVDLFCKGDS